MTHRPPPAQSKRDNNAVILPAPPSNMGFHLPPLPTPASSSSSSSYENGSGGDIEKGEHKYNRDTPSSSSSTFSGSDKDSINATNQVNGGVSGAGNNNNSNDKNGASGENNNSSQSSSLSSSSSSLLFGVDADGWRRIARGTIVTAIGVGLYCTPAVREFIGVQAWILMVTTLVYTAMGPQAFGFVVDRAVKMELVVCAVCCLSLLAVRASGGGNSFALLAWLCAGAYPMGLLASYDLSWFGASFLGTIYYYVILFESYAIALKKTNSEMMVEENNNYHGEGEMGSQSSGGSSSFETLMMDYAKESCLSLIVATVIGTAICVGVNGLFLSEYGTARFEETVRDKVLPRLGTVLRLAVDTQLNGCRDRNADHKDSAIRKELYDARAELQTILSPLPMYLAAARLELRFCDPSKGERMTRLFGAANGLAGRVLAVTHVLCAEENEASRELWRDAFAEVDAHGRFNDCNSSHNHDDVDDNQGRRDLTNRLNAYLESSLLEFSNELQNEIKRLASMLEANSITNDEDICDNNGTDNMMKIDALSSNVEERLCAAVQDVVVASKQQEQKESTSGERNKSPTMMYWFVRSEGKRTVAFIHGMRTLLLPLTNFRNAVVAGCHHRRDSSSSSSNGSRNGTMNRNESYRNEWKKTFPFMTTPERVDWLDEIEYCGSSEKEEEKMDHSKYTKSPKKFLVRLARFLHSDHASTTFKFILALAIGAGFSYFPVSYELYDSYGGIAMVGGIISLGMRVEVGWYLDLTLYKFLGLLAAMAWALLWYAFCFILPMTPAMMATGDGDNAVFVEATRDAWYTNVGLALMQTVFFVAVSIFTTKYPSYVYAGLMANVLFIFMTGIPMGAPTGHLQSFRSFGTAAGWRLVGTIAGALVMTLVGVLINPVYAYKRVSGIMADIIHDTSLTLARSITVPMELISDDGENEGMMSSTTTMKNRCKLVRDIGQFQAWAKLQIGSAQMLLEPSRFEVQLEDNGRYNSNTAQLLLGHINSSITNIQHMVLLSPDYSELRERGMVITHEQWFVNRMAVLQLGAVESSLRSCRPLVPAYPSATFDATRRFDACLSLRRQVADLIGEGNIHEATRQMSRAFFTILLIHDVARIEALISSMYGNRSKKYLQSLETNTMETYDDKRMAGNV